MNDVFYWPAWLRASLDDGKDGDRSSEGLGYQAGSFSLGFNEK